MSILNTSLNNKNGNYIKERLPALDAIRGISMLGVVGIHIGSFYLMNPYANIYLVALFEIVTRFSVPIFFFVSAFGLFYNLDLNKPFNYIHFLKRRSVVIVVPYITWSFIYLIHDYRMYFLPFPDIWHLAIILFFGNAKYQLYFMVILLWFYILMPLIIKIVKNINFYHITIMMMFQLIFNYWSSFSSDLNYFVYSLPDMSVLRALLYFRLNYWPMHYLFIFILGGYLATKSDLFLNYIKDNFKKISLFFFISLLIILSYYYQLLTVKGYTPLEAVNTAHQLSPAGVLYTIASSIFLFALFTHARKLNLIAFCNIFEFLGKHSYFCYLAHPMTITYLSLLITKSGLTMNSWLAIAFYFTTLLITLIMAIIFQKISNKIPLTAIFITGTYKK